MADILQKSHRGLHVGVNADGAIELTQRISLDSDSMHKTFFSFYKQARIVSVGLNSSPSFPDKKKRKKKENRKSRREERGGGGKIPETNNSEAAAFNFLQHAVSITRSFQMHQLSGG